MYTRELGETLQNLTVEQARRLGEKLDHLTEVAGVPQRDIPTIEELVEEAKSDPARRKVLEQTLSELEFADPIVGFN